MIRFYFETNFNFAGKNQIKLWLKNLIESHNLFVGNINFIFVDDEQILKINNQYLSHDYYTDIITFNYNKEDSVNSDIYISIERIKENANLYQTNIREEFLRVIVHGVLHLLGFNDSTDKEKERMRALENEQIAKIDYSKILL